jgi:hypothetical protein
MAAPTTPSLAYKVETWVIDCLNEHATLTGVPVVHHDEDTDAANNRIVVTAKLGDRVSEGAQPFEVEVGIRAFVITRNAGLIEDYSKAVDATLADPPTVASLSEFTYLSILDSEEEDKDVRADSRQREKRFTFHALEDTELVSSGFTFLTPTGDDIFQPDGTSRFMQPA